MSEQEVYQNFIDWLGKTWWGLPDSEHLLPLIKARYKMLVKSGVVIQNPDGSLEAVTPEEAQKRIADMDADTRTLYELI